MIRPRVGVVCRGETRRRQTVPYAESYLIGQEGRATWLNGDHEQRETVVGAGVVAVVADGEGEDEAAARVAATSAVRGLLKLWPAGLTDDAARLGDFLSNAHTRMYWHARERQVRMGASVALAWVDAARLGWAEIGTGRVWRWRDGRLTRLGHDREDLTTQRYLSGSVGMGDNSAIFLRPGVNVGVTDVREGDQVLVATDGLWRTVDEPSIAQVLTHTDDPQAAAVTCMERAIARGGTDHVTVIVLDLRPPRAKAEVPSAVPEPRKLRKDAPPVRKTRP